MVLPSATGSSIFDPWNTLLVMHECIDTVCGSRFGTSIPMAALPGIGAMMRTPEVAAMHMAISSCRFRTLLILVPVSSTISKRVMVGPTMAVILCISIP